MIKCWKNKWESRGKKKTQKQDHKVLNQLQMMDFSQVLDNKTNLQRIQS